MNAETLRTALTELNGQRDLRVEFDRASECCVHKALLIPAEEDGLVKVTDGERVYILEASKVAWIEIG